MKTTVLITSLILLATSFTSCTQLEKLTGKKTGDEEQQKLEAVAVKVAEKLAEQQKKEAEEKAKHQQEIEVEVQKRLAALAAQAPQTQPTTQPTTQPMAQQPQVIEKVVVVQGGGSSGEAKPSKGSGYVRLYDDKGFSDRSLSVSFGRDIGNLHYVSSDDGKSGFNDKASSVKYSVPAGWQAVLYENNNYAKRGYALTGSGSIADLGYFGDKCSSIRWEKK